MARLNQVFLNLLVNAGQAINGRGEITITTFHRYGKVFVQIADTGAGIREDDLDKIFEPGFTTKGVGIGTGLGLSISYRIVREHHGAIEVESAVGKGTTFTVVLPTNLEAILGARSEAAV
jgi:signal transduction histidine kinase